MDYSNIIDTTIELEPETTTWVSNMIGVSSFEVSAINRYVIREKQIQLGQSVSNQSLKDVEYSLQLGLVNSVVGSDGVTIGVLYGGVTSDSKGLLFNGVDGYMDPGYDASSYGGNYVLQDGLVSSYIYDETTIGAIKMYLGVSSSSQLIINYRNQIAELAIKINRSVGGLNTDVRFANADVSKSLLTSTMVNNRMYMYLNGVNVGSRGINATGIPDANIYIGGRNGNGTMDFPTNAKQSIATFGSAIGFDHDWHNQNVVMLVADLASGSEFNDYATAQAWVDAN